MELVSMLPWWGGVALALASYVLLHQLAQPPSGKGLQAGQMGGFAANSLLSALAMIGQFLVPIVCLFGALGSFLARNRRQTLMSNVSQSKSADALNDMSWREFELLVGEAFRLQGYRVSEQGGAGPDGGIDLVLSKGSEKYLGKRGLIRVDARRSNWDGLPRRFLQQISRYLQENQRRRPPKSSDRAPR